MARLQGLRRLEKTDFPQEFRGVVDRIGYAFNSFAEEVIDAFNNKRITFENLNRRLHTITLEVDSAGRPVDSLILQPGVVNFKGCNIIAVSSDSDTIISGAPFISFQRLTNNTVRVNNVTGLPTGITFTLTVEIIGD